MSSVDPAVDTFLSTHLGQSGFGVLTELFDCLTVDTVFIFKVL